MLVGALTLCVYRCWLSSILFFEDIRPVFEYLPYISDNMAHLEFAKDYRKLPLPGAPYSVAVPGTEQQGRSAVYRHFRFQNGILKSLDPNVSKYNLRMYYEAC